MKIHHNLLDYYSYPASVPLKHITYNEHSKKMLPDYENVSLAFYSFKAVFLWFTAENAPSQRDDFTVANQDSSNS